MLIVKVLSLPDGTAGTVLAAPGVTFLLQKEVIFNPRKQPSGAFQPIFQIPKGSGQDLELLYEAGFTLEVLSVLETEGFLFEEGESLSAFFPPLSWWGKPKMH